MLYYTILYKAILYYAILYYTTLYYAMLSYTNRLQALTPAARPRRSAPKQGVVSAAPTQTSGRVMIGYVYYSIIIIVYVLVIILCYIIIVYVLI